MKLVFTILCLIYFMTGHGQSKNFSFADIVALTAIQKIEVQNNKGRHVVNKSKLEKIKKELGKMTVGQHAIKVGMKQILIWINNKSFTLHGATNGCIIEVTAAIATKNKQLFGNQNTLYFNANGLNMDNY